MESYDITVHGRTVGAVKTSHGPGPSRDSRQAGLDRAGPSGVAACLREGVRLEWLRVPVLLSEAWRRVPGTSWGLLRPTPGRHPYSAHHLNEKGPLRNIPGRVVDKTINPFNIVEQLGDRTVYCDPENDVTEVQGDTTGKITSVRGGLPGATSFQAPRSHMGIYQSSSRIPPPRGRFRYLAWLTSPILEK
jgi:hypothetical protein